ncbi:MAG: 30S ribosomal protein S7 [Deltaproteobacteria bacterium]|nr:30S ribosomal protein S7 [Deltaproteobacteria bacterium]
MARRRESPKRKVLPDPKFHDRLLTKFINALMKRGKKSTAEQICYGAFDLVAEKAGGEEPLAVFKKALENVKPRIEVKSRRVGGATFQVPIEVRPERRTSLGMRWLISYAQRRSERTMREKLAAEIVEAASGRGAAVKKREETHKMADANKAFAHFRW